MEEDGSFIFYETDYLQSSFSSFQDMRMKREHTDVTIKCNHRSFLAHRVVLAARIPHLRDCLISQDKEISLNEIDSDVLDSIINFAYEGKLKVTAEKLHSMLFAAMYLRLDQVQKPCLEFQAKTFNPNGHVKTIKLIPSDVTIRDNFDEFYKSDEFLLLPYYSLRELISRDDLKVTNEKTVFEALMRWIKASCMERHDRLPYLLPEIRMNYISPEFLIENVANEVLIKVSDQCRHIVREATSFHLLKKRPMSVGFKTMPRLYSGTNWRITHNCNTRCNLFDNASSTALTENVSTLGDSAVSGDVGTRGNSAVTENVSTQGNSAVTGNVSTQASSVVTANVSTQGSSVVTRDVSTEANSAVTENVSTQPNNAVTETISTQPNSVVTGNVSTQANSAVTENVSTQANTAITENVLTQPNSAVTENGLVQDNTAIAENLSTQASSENVSAQDSNVVTENVSSQDNNTVTENISTQGSLLHNASNSTVVSETVSLCRSENNNVLVSFRDGIYAVSSFSSGGTYVSYYDNRCNKWKKFSANSSSVFVQHAAFVSDKLYIFFLKSVEMFHLVTCKWCTVECLPVTTEGSGVVSNDNKIYIFGGLELPEVIRCFDTQGNEWLEDEVMNVPCYSMSVVSSPERDIYLTGGYDSICSDSFVKFHPATKEWTLMPPMFYHRMDHASAILNGKLYVCGGHNDHEDFLDTAEIFDEVSNGWSCIAYLRISRYSHSLVTWNGNLYVFGGETECSVCSCDVEVYDPQDNKWIDVITMAPGSHRVIDITKPSTSLETLFPISLKAIVAISQ